MSYCLNPNCSPTINSPDTKFCTTCGSKLLLAERYRAIKQIGQGGFGRTFLAVDEYKPKKPRCVIKQFFPLAQGTNNVEKASELFKEEAARLDELGHNHPFIPELLAYFTQDNQQYLVQEFIDGQNLAEELKNNGAFNEAQIMSFLNNLLPVLQFVHSKKVIHRDIKPENIIQRSDGELVLVDFGAAKTVNPTALSVMGTVIGTAGYTPPEQAVGKATFASDIYSLGVTCLNLLTQIQPFELFDVIEGEWVWRNYLSSPVSDSLGQVLDKMVEGTVKRRYQSIIEVLQALNSDKIAATIINPPQSASVPIAKSPLNSKVEVESLLARNQIKCPFCSYTFDGTNLSGEIACYRCYMHFSVFPKQMKVSLSTSNQTPDNLSSQNGVDYTKLRNFLKAGNWKEADYETYRVMLQVVGRKENDWIRDEEILNFPCTDLRTINQLWVKYSNGRFGLSVQKKIYLEVGGVPDGKYYRKAIEKFGASVGWRVNTRWIQIHEVTNDTTAPLGHLPFRFSGVGGGGVLRAGGTLLSHPDL